MADGPTRKQLDDWFGKNMVDTYGEQLVRNLVASKDQGADMPGFNRPDAISVAPTLPDAAQLAAWKHHQLQKEQAGPGLVYDFKLGPNDMRAPEAVNDDDWTSHMLNDALWWARNQDDADGSGKTYGREELIKSRREARDPNNPLNRADGVVSQQPKASPSSEQQAPAEATKKDDAAMLAAYLADKQAKERAAAQAAAQAAEDERNKAALMAHIQAAMAKTADQWSALGQNAPQQQAEQAPIRPVPMPDMLQQFLQMKGRR
jgi:hypothetical protein